MRNLFTIIVWSTVALMMISGCGGAGGQGIVVKLVAERHSEIENVHININIADGGTELDGIFYRPKVAGDVSMGEPTTQPSE